MNLKNDWKKAVLDFTKGKGVDVVFDSIGSILADSIAVTKECGTIVFYGMAGGDLAPVDPRILMNGSKRLIGGDLWSYLISKKERIKRVTKLFDWLRIGDIKRAVPTVFKLSEGKKAHDFFGTRSECG